MVDKFSEGDPEPTEVAQHQPDLPQEDPNAALEKLAGPQRRVIEEAFAAIGTSTFNPLFHKVTEDHITQMLALAEKDMAYAHGDRKDSRRTLSLVWGFTVLVALGFVLAMAALGKDDLIIETAKIVGPFIGGAGLGYAFGVRRRS